MKTVKQSIWPVSVFGLGFLILILGLSGVASIQETRSIHEQILSVEDNYRHIERLAEAIRSDVSRVAVLRRDRLLEPHVSPSYYSGQLAELRARLAVNLDQVEVLRSEQGGGKAFDRLESSLHTYLDAVDVEFRNGRSDPNSFAFDALGAHRTTIFAVTEELEKLNEDNFERRRRALNQSVENLQNDIWETMLTALVLGSVIAGASIFRISSLERETAEHQRATEQAEERLRLLSQQLVSSQEQERKSLSRELHDEIGQLLTALRMELGNLERAQGTSRDITPHLDQAKRLAESTLRTTRDIAMGLRPAMLDLLGLGPALEWQTREFTRRYETPIHLEVDGDLKHLSDRHRTYLYRIVQEGLTNCARHAHAKNIRVQLQEANGQIAVAIEDDGIGFKQQDGVAYGLGLLGITERVRELCGQVSIDSVQGKGTRISVVLPVGQAPELTE